MHLGKSCTQGSAKTAVNQYGASTISYGAGRISYGAGTISYGACTISISSLVGLIGWRSEQTSIDQCFPNLFFCCPAIKILFLRDPLKLVPSIGEIKHINENTVLILYN